MPFQSKKMCGMAFIKGEKSFFEVKEVSAAACVNN